MKPENCNSTSKDDRSSPNMSPVERMLAEATPQYQREHMSPSRRQERADALRRLRRARSVETRDE